MVYQEGAKIADIEPAEIRKYLAQSNRFVWVALAEPDPPALAEMQGQFELHPLAVEDACHGHLCTHSSNDS